MTFYRYVVIALLANYLAVSLMSGDYKTKLIGILLTIVNWLVFWK